MIKKQSKNTKIRFGTKITRQYTEGYDTQLTQSLPKIPGQISLDKEIHNKVRALEIMMIDFKVEIERRLFHIEQNPQQYFQQFKSLGSQQVQMWKNMNDKQTFLQETVQQVKIQSDRNRDQLTQMVMDLSKKLSDTELRIKSYPISDAVEKQFLQQNNTDSVLIHDSISTDKVYREGLIADMQKQDQQMDQRLNKQQSEFFSKLKQLRNQSVEFSTKQLKRPEKKIQKNNQQASHRAILYNEQKFKDENLKQYIDSQLQYIKDNFRLTQQNINQIEQSFQTSMQKNQDSSKELEKTAQKLILDTHLLISQFVQVAKKVNIIEAEQTTNNTKIDLQKNEVGILCQHLETQFDQIDQKFAALQKTEQVSSMDKQISKNLQNRIADEVERRLTNSLESKLKSLGEEFELMKENQTQVDDTISEQEQTIHDVIVGTNKLSTKIQEKFDLVEEEIILLKKKQTTMAAEIESQRANILVELDKELDKVDSSIADLQNDYVTVKIFDRITKNMQQDYSHLEKDIQKEFDEFHTQFDEIKKCLAELGASKYQKYKDQINNQLDER